VIDPAQGISGVLDVGIDADRVAYLGKTENAPAREVIDASGLIVTPGLIDIHVHVYDGVAPLGIPADPSCLRRGVTTVVDAGSAGAHTFPGFVAQVISVVETRVYALLNISVIGQSSFSMDTQAGELLELRYADPAAAVRVIKEHRDLIIGVKVRLSRNIAGSNDLRALELAKEAALAVGLPVMVHIGATHASLREILGLLGDRDIVTHVFHGHDGGILDEHLRVRPEVEDAVIRGVRFDVGHGAGSFSFEVAEAAMRQGLLPGTISSDIHRWNVDGPVYDLATTLSKFLHLGMSLEEVVRRATANAASTFRFPAGLGSLAPGAPADLSLFRMEGGTFEFHDALGFGRPPVTRIGDRRLVPTMTIKSGRVFNLHEDA
jgi:dihydroorotase